ncbi:MAG TPA: hypothetical protein VFA85_09950 [Terriglobales bacterium]|nr:hypothetical protein [Terriglobales bacterium]
MPERERSHGHIHRLRTRIPGLKFSHLVLATLALVISLWVIKSNPASTVTVLFLFFGFMALLLVFEGYTDDRSIPTSLLNTLTLIAPIIFVVAVSVSLTFLIVGKSVGYVPPDQRKNPSPPVLQPAPQPAVTPVPPLPPLPERVKIASAYQEAGGCQDTARAFAVSIPHVERLNTSLSGPISGIELVQTTNNGRSGIRNLAFGSGSVTFDLFAGGGGSAQHIPWPVDRDVCVGASGGSTGYDVYAHYSAPNS